MAKGGVVNLNMEDHRTEDYVKPKVTLKAFSGEGHKLGRFVFIFVLSLLLFCLYDCKDMTPVGSLVQQYGRNSVCFLPVYHHNLLANTLRPFT